MLNVSESLRSMSSERPARARGARRPTCGGARAGRRGYSPSGCRASGTVVPPHPVPRAFSNSAPTVAPRPPPPPISHPPPTDFVSRLRVLHQLRDRPRRLLEPPRGLAPSPLVALAPSRQIGGDGTDRRGARVAGAARCGQRAGCAAGARVSAQGG